MRHWALDGKSLRGAALKADRKPHLLCVLDTATGIVLGQVSVDGKTNEISMFQPLLRTLGSLRQVVVTADAMHVQTAHAQFLHTKGAGLLVTVKADQRTLLAHLKNIPWKQITAITDEIETRRHHRTERCITKTTSDSRGLPFAHAEQAIQTTRYLQTTNKNGRPYWKKPTPPTASPP